MGVLSVHSALSHPIIPEFTGVREGGGKDPRSGLPVVHDVPIAVVHVEPSEGRFAVLRMGDADAGKQHDGG